MQEEVNIDIENYKAKKNDMDGHIAEEKGEEYG